MVLPHTVHLGIRMVLPHIVASWHLHGTAAHRCILEVLPGSPEERRPTMHGTAAHYYILSSATHYCISTSANARLATRSGK
jgi:hypothetical protein